MKKILKLIFSISIFFVLTIGIKAESAFTWACEYEYNNDGVDVKLQYRMTGVPQSVIKSQNALKSAGSAYTTMWYYSKKQGKYVPASAAINDYEGHSAGDGYVYPGGLENVVRSEMIWRSISSTSVVCPTLYFNSLCRNKTKGGLYATYDLYYADTTTGESCKSLPVTSKGAACYTSSGQKIDCSKMISQEQLYSSNKLECEYKTESDINGKKSFKITYDTTNGLQYDNGGGKIQVEWQDKSRLEEIFKNQLSKNACPSRVSCAVTGIFNWGGRVKVGSNGGSFNGNNGCGNLISNNGNDISDTGNYTVSLNGTGLDISEQKMSCEELLGKNLKNVLHLFITGLRIAGAIIAIINGMLSLIPAITSDNADALKKAIKKCVMMLIVLAIIGLFPTLIRVIGLIAGFDLSCL